MKIPTTRKTIVSVAFIPLIISVGESSRWSSSRNPTRSLREQLLQLAHLVPRAELLKCLRLTGPVLEIRAQHLLDHAGQFLRRDTGEDLPPDCLVLREAATDEEVIRILALAVDLGLRAETADVAHVMLRAGVRTTGDMDVHRLIEFQLLLQLLDDFKRVALGVCLRELAIG